MFRGRYFRVISTNRDSENDKPANERWFANSFIFQQKYTRHFFGKSTLIFYWDGNAIFIFVNFILIASAIIYSEYARNHQSERQIKFIPNKIHKKDIIATYWVFYRICEQNTPDNFFTKQILFHSPSPLLLFCIFLTSLVKYLSTQTVIFQNDTYANDAKIQPKSESVVKFLHPRNRLL